jgi:hypothetical protein
MLLLSMLTMLVVAVSARYFVNHVILHEHQKNLDPNTHRKIIIRTLQLHLLLHHVYLIQTDTLFAGTSVHLIKEGRDIISSKFTHTGNTHTPHFDTHDDINSNSE